MNQATFSIIQSLCRIGLGADNPAFQKQVERLRDQFEKDSEEENSKALSKILNSVASSTALQPSKVSLSPSFAGFEKLTKNVSAPTDRETGAALAEIIFPTEEDAAFPLLEESLTAASESIVEEWTSHERLLAEGILPPSTCLIYGLPGTGKTCLAMGIAAALGLPVVLARLDGLISSFLGTTGRNVGNLFAFANRYTCVLLLDEFDAIAKVRDDPHEVGEIKRVVNAILQNIDQRRGRGLTIAITNHENLLDSAVWRRFDMRIAVPPPSFEVRKLIAQRYFSEDLRDDPTIQFMAWLSQGMTGADIEMMAKSVRRHRVLHPEASLLAALRHFSLTQATQAEAFHAKMLSLKDEALGKAMSEDAGLGLTQRKIANLLGISQSKISRQPKP